MRLPLPKEYTTAQEREQLLEEELIAWVILGFFVGAVLAGSGVGVLMYMLWPSCPAA